MTIDYAALAERIEQAIDSQPLTVPEVALIEKADLRAVVTVLEGMAEEKPAMWAQSNHVSWAGTQPFMVRCAPSQLHPDFMPLYLHPAPQPIPEGWQLVPKKPTGAMRLAGGHANSEWLNDNAPLGESRYAMPMDSVWTAMLDAAPQPQPEPIDPHMIVAEDRFPDEPEPTEAQIEQLRNALVIAEAALADIGDADREPGDNLAWCEQRAAEALPDVRAALAAKEKR